MASSVNVRSTLPTGRSRPHSPDAPIFAITIYRRFWDVVSSVNADGREGTPDEFRAAYHDVVEALDDNVFLVEGTDPLTDIDGTSTDFVHPGNSGMREIGERLAERVRTSMELGPETEDSGRSV